MTYTFTIDRPAYYRSSPATDAIESAALTEFEFHFASRPPATQAAYAAAIAAGDDEAAVVAEIDGLADLVMSDTFKRANEGLHWSLTRGPNCCGLPTISLVCREED